MSADQSITAARLGAGTPFARWIRRAACNVARRAAAWIERRRLKNILAELTDAQLRDIGLSRGETFREANMALWKPRSLHSGELHIRPEEPDVSIVIEASASGKPLPVRDIARRENDHHLLHPL